ncbi:MAG: META domain-containing protein [Anaerolineae bacterium]|nr:META domain-containing protein [Anaerolineae bacterium]
MRFRSISLLLLALLMLVPLPLAQAQEADHMIGTHWQLVRLGGQPLIADTSITLSFGAQNSAGGTGSCNSYGSTVTRSGSAGIAFSDLFSTMMACAPDIMEQEAAYFAALQAATGYRLVGGQLILTDSTGDTLVFDPRLTLPDTTWRLVSLNGADLAAGSDITLSFAVDGAATGSGGCNSYGSSYTTDSGGLTFTAPVRTEMACMDDAVMAQETAYLNALAAATGYRIDGPVLTIFYGTAGATLVFEREFNLPGTTWRLESLNAAPVDAGSSITLNFDAADSLTVNGSGGCNQYSSPWSLTGADIAFGPVVSTRMACAEPVLAVESAYFAALAASTRLELIAGRLYLSADDGTRLVFVATAGQ